MFYMTSSSEVIAMTVIYVLISITSVIGNVTICYVISRTKAMHTPPNCYLFSMAISDLLLLITGIPNEIQWLWYPSKYIFSEALCIFRGLANETSTNASILTICAFTIERYVAVCHPLRSRTMSQLGRVIASIVFIWILGCLCAIPQAVQYGLIHYQQLTQNGIRTVADCTLTNELSAAFEISTLVFFIFPMVLITILYMLIVKELRHQAHLARVRRPLSTCTVDWEKNESIIKVLVAVVVGFFICWLPFHLQRLLAVHGDATNAVVQRLFVILTHISGVLTYTSTCINPILYHIFCSRFRKALKVIILNCFSNKSTNQGEKSSATLVEYKKTVQDTRKVDLSRSSYLNDSGTDNVAHLST
ncbi:unnamed protein product, partial [Meganyctiphanes norvegica]